ncbi:MATE family efflux transporter [Halobacteriovorax sp. HLS]|uniref:MATE family efflux transporter n=1 Tax=Halobacteriovorax sp. HLS TaxID=2234000 RepID=UPI000FD81FD6|nr:MATE family efflux transporter [Halobacteriovorax sp. HLS]
MNFELSKLLKLSLPIFLAQLGVVLLGVTDMIMLGQFDELSLKASGIANVWVIGTLMFGIGCCLGVDPFIAKFIGQQNSLEVKKALISGKFVAILIALVLSTLWLCTGDVLEFFGQSDVYTKLAHDYALVQIPSLIPFFMYMVFRQYLIGHEKASVVAIVLLLTNFVNVILNWIFIYGAGPIEAMGLFGAGLSTCIMRACQYLFLCLLIGLSKRDKHLWVPFSWQLVDWVLVKNILLIGLPIGLSFMLEAFGLQLTTFLASRIGDNELAAHSILVNLQYLFFSIPMAISIAAAIRIGITLGQRKEVLNVIRASFIAITFLVTPFCLILYFLNQSIVELYGVSGMIKSLANSSIIGAALFLYLYSLQQVMGALLRGRGRTFWPSIVNISSLYLVGLPIAYYLSMKLSYGLSGLWYGLSGSMFVCCLGLGLLNLNSYKAQKNQLS